MEFSSSLLLLLCFLLKNAIILSLR